MPAAETTEKAVDTEPAAPVAAEMAEKAVDTEVAAMGACQLILGGMQRSTDISYYAQCNHKRGP